MTKCVCFVLLIFSTDLLCNDAPERVHQEKWCDQENGKIEAVLSDGTRVDCLTDQYAVEFDFGNKWAESIGQSLGYSIETLKKPGIVLILRRKKDYKYWIKLNSVIDFYHLPIKTWKIESY